MSKPLPLDFARPTQRPPLISWLLLALGLAGAAWAAQDHLAAQARRDQARVHLASLEQAARPARPARADDRAQAQLQARQRLDGTARRHLGLPWAMLVETLQDTRPRDIAFLALNADGRRGDFQVQAEAPGERPMLAYLGRLQATDGLRDVVLTQHETVDSDGVSALRFSLRGNWGPAREATPVNGGGTP